MDYFEKVADIVQKLTDTLAQAQDVARMLYERIVDIENRQDTLWKALQGLMGKYNEQEQAIINLGKEIRDGNGRTTPERTE